MNIMQKLTLRCMKLNRKRTCVTIFGVIICVSMITAVCVLVPSFQDVMVRSTIITKGSYEFMLSELNDQAINKAYEDERLDKKMRLQMIGEASLNDFHIKNTYRTNVRVAGIDTTYLDLYAITLKQGHMPQRADEIVLSEELMRDKGFQYKIGDTITLQLNTQFNQDNDTKASQLKKQKYNITGVVSSKALQSALDTFIAFTVYQKAEDPKANDQMLLATLKSKKDLYDQINSIAKNAGQSIYQMNNGILMFNHFDDYSMMPTLASVCIFVFIIILIGGISLIYNAFSISLKERSRYLGMLSSIGATRKQKRASVFFEAAVIGSIAIPIGMLCGIGGLAITFMLINPHLSVLFDTDLVGLRVMIQPYFMLFTLLFSVVILFISAWLPARRATHISAIRAIRQNEDIIIKQRDVRTSRLTKKIFGIEADIGLKNMKRNHARYLATLSAIIICIVLFMSASYFSSAMYKSASMTLRSTQADVLVDMFPKSEEQKLLQFPDEGVIKQLRTTPSTKSSVYFAEKRLLFGHDVRYSQQAKQYFDTLYPDMEITNYQDMLPGFLLQALDDDAFTAYCKKVGISTAAFHQDVPSVILINQRSTRYGKKQQFADITWLDMKKSDILHFLNNNGQEENDSNKKPVVNKSQRLKVIAETSELPPLNYDNGPEVVMVTNFATINKLNQLLLEAKLKQIDPICEIQYKAKDAIVLEQELNEVLETNTKGVSASISNISAERMLSTQRNLLVSVLLYGFVTLIALICIANIINTISTSVNLRKREFAMIKSVGITKKKFNRMVRFEILFYGLKACLYGLPLGTLMMYQLHILLGTSFYFNFEFPWKSTVIMIAGIFIILFLTMSYAINKIKNDNIVETIRSESI